jgi:Fe-S-cluster containining protein
MFQVVNLTDDEARWAKRRNLPIVEQDGRTSMKLTCACLTSNGHCTAYDERPQTCRTFRCSLLRSLEANEVTLDAALAHVTRAKALAEQVGRGAMDLTRLTAERMMQVAELNGLLTEHFHDPEREFLDDDDAT